MNRNLHQRGDTIVEVLIAMAVASSVLATTYVTMNRNLNITRASQERTEASKLAQGQIEALKARTDAGDGVINDTFCLDISDELSEVPLPDTTPVNADINEPFAPYVTAGCVQDGIYHYGTRKMDPFTYRFYVRWDRVGGPSREEIIMVYRL